MQWAFLGGPAIYKVIVAVPDTLEYPLGPIISYEIAPGRQRPKVRGHNAT